MVIARWLSTALLLGLMSFAACGARTGLELGGFAAGGAGGEASGWVVDAFRQSAITKVDLLLTLDNSISMADKQVLLAEAVPLLVQRLITAGSAVDPVSDVHVGVITSSLGSHGASGERDVCVSVEDDDHAHLLGQLRGLSGTWRNEGFLAWDPRREQQPPGDTDPTIFADKLRRQVQSAGERGCGYEATLESWYRFLVDPEPPLRIVVTGADAGPEGVDQEVLQQRSAFLRPDSLVAIIMLSDENDCSLRDDGQSWLAARSTPLFRSTSACARSPNDPCCQSCASPRLANCPDVATDAECNRGQLETGEDDLNLRCWQQKRRFGVDFMYPTLRYSDALSSSVVTSLGGQARQNPLFAAPAGFLARDPSLIYLAGIVGVPWQDIADEPSLSGKGLRYLTASELSARGRWDVILGDPEANPPVLPSDPFMVESTQDRTFLPISQRNPVVGDVRLVGASSLDPHANVINGHEQVDLSHGDLQYACTFPLDVPRVCDQAALDAGKGCDCYQDDVAYNRSICQPPSMGSADIIQRSAKAYPGLRHLQVLKEVGDAAIVASICPKVLDKSADDYGYNPAVAALIDRVTNSVVRRCLPRALPLDAGGRVPCEVVQAFPRPAEGCGCAALGLVEIADPTLGDAVQSKLEDLGQCGSTDPKCTALCRCELPQLAGQALEICQNAQQTADISGFCYISATTGEPAVGNAEFVRDCPGTGRRDLRILRGAPKTQLFTLLACPTD
jgi:hypothetical protein